jgi:hypothetical protein
VAEARVCLGETDACGHEAGNSASANGSPGCDDPGCCADVCAVDPYCCVDTWDENCAVDAAEICGLALCPWDVDGDGVVGVLDFLALLAHWGPCP